MQYVSRHSQVIKRGSLATLVLLGAVAPTRVAAADAPAISYKAIDLGVFPGDQSSGASDVNDRGDVVGVSWPADPLTGAVPRSRAVIWRNHGVEDLGTLPAPYDLGAVANRVNRHAAVVGSSEGPDHTSHAFLWRDGVMIDLGTLGGPSSAAVAINDHNQIVGWAETSTSYQMKGRQIYVRHAFLWHNGVMQDLGTLGCSGTCPNQEGSFPTDINDAGEITGWTSSSSGFGGAFIWSRGTMRLLTGLAPGDQAEVAGINDRGDAVGTDDMQNYAPIIWRHGSEPTSLGESCAGFGGGLAINNARAVLSYSNQGPVTPFVVPRVCRRGTVTFLPPLDLIAGDSFGVRINDFGAVAGRSDLTDHGIRYVATHAVLWVPDSQGDCD